MKIMPKRKNKLKSSWELFSQQTYLGRWFGSSSKSMGKYIVDKKKNGFTMIELLVVLSVLGFFTTAGAVGFQASQRKGRDASRKSDLARVKLAFEDYYNDNNCYPAEGALTACGSSSLQPYLQRIPCDPISDDPYLYVPLENECQGYRLQVALEDENDPDIANVGCDGGGGCGYDADHNYGVASGATVYDPDGASWGIGEESPSPNPSGSPVSSLAPSPSGPIYVYACDSGGTCNQFEEGHPFLFSCPVTFEQSDCNSECANPALQCSG
jgi:prepilin-type N-terminal cleavage/methylation domain-containing protein